MLCLVHQQQRVQILVRISPLTRTTAISASSSAASVLLHARACLRCIAVVCGLSRRLLFFHRCTDESSALHTQLQGFPFLFVHTAVGLA